MTRRKLILVPLSICLSLAVFELLLHIWKPELSFKNWYANSLTYLLDDDVQWKLEPRKYAWGQVNQFNFRGREIPIAKSKGTCRIIVVGGSAAFDLYSPDNRTWTVQLEDELRRARPASNIEVLNAATPGYSTWQAYEQVKTKLLKWHPDMVLLYELYNDSLTFSHSNRQEIMDGWKLNARANYISSWAHANRYLDAFSFFLPRTTDFVRMWSVHSLMMHKMVDSGAFWMNPNLDWKLQKFGLEFYEENRRNLSKILLQSGSIPLVIVTQASLIRETNTPEEETKIRYVFRGLNHSQLWQGYQAAREIDRRIAATEPNVLLIEAHKEIPSNLSFFFDEVHLNEKGDHLLAEIVSKQLLSFPQLFIKK